MAETGRPPKDRELLYAYIKAGHSTRFIRMKMKQGGFECSTKTIRRAKKELEVAGDLALSSDLDKHKLAFDDQIKAVTGLSFLTWLKNRTKAYGTIFKFTHDCWLTIFEKKPIALIKDSTRQDADIIAQNWLSKFLGDKKSIRNHKKKIRFFFRFLGRSDINDRHFTMSRDKDPINTKEFPELTILESPANLERSIDEVKKEFSGLGELFIKLKIVSQMRTGSTKDQREMMGITVNDSSKDSYLIMKSVDDFVFKVKAKKNEYWNITWIPIEVRTLLWKIYKTKSKGETLFEGINIEKFRSRWKVITENQGLPPMSLHDLRKVSITYLWVMGLPLEIAVSLNVGWRDMNTPKDHYLEYRQLLGKEKRRLYREKIPAWFKEGLSEYMDDTNGGN